MSRPTPTDRRPGWQWSEFWQSGRSAIMTVDTPEGPVAFDPGATWRRFFGGFETGSRLLDLATGGGHVARLGHETAAAEGKSYDIVGVDYADLGPSEGELAPGLRLMGGVSVEKLPFENASFDGATSQFGIEYADTRRALGELARILKPKGRACLLLHHAGSAVSLSTAAQMAAHDKVLPDDEVIHKARRAFAAHAQRRPRDVLEKTGETFREAVRAAAARLEEDEAFDQVRYHVDYLKDLAERIARYEPNSALARLEIFEAGVGAWRGRHRSQMKAALDRGGLDVFLDRAARSGLSPLEALEEHDARGALIAWRVELRRD